MFESKSLRRVLLADAVISGASGLLMLLAAAPLGPPLGVAPELLRYAGLSLLPFAAFVTWIATRPALSRTSVWTVIALNAAWVVASIGVLFIDGFEPSRAGVAFIILQAVAVAGLADAQYVGLRNRMPA